MRVLSEGPRNYFKDRCLMKLHPTSVFTSFLTKWGGHYQKYTIRSHNSLKLNFTNIQSFLSNFVECESFLESNSSDILGLYARQTWMTQFILSISLWERCLSLMRKDSVTHAWSCSLDRSNFISCSTGRS